jgi:DNA-binding NtrC family response regulator
VGLLFVLHAIELLDLEAACQEGVDGVLMGNQMVGIIGNDNGLLQSVKLSLHEQGVEIHELTNGIKPLRCSRNRAPDLLIISSSEREDSDGIERLREIREWNKEIPILMISTRGSVDSAIAAFRLGINGHFKLPFSYRELALAITQYLSGSFQSGSAANPGKMVSSICADGPLLIGESQSMREIKASIRRVAQSGSNVLITGQTGTGKEVVAELIHRNSKRSRNSLVCINCAAIPETLLESELFGHEKGAFTGAHSQREGKLRMADEGTIFLDEIGDMSPFSQAKLLRVLESKRFHRLGGDDDIPSDFRVISATNEDLEARVSEGKFRRDLYYRLNVVRIHLSPLRKRKEDIPMLCDFFIHEMNSRFGREVEGTDPDVMEALLRYDWPGNVRELRNLLEAIFVNLTSCTITLRDLPEHFRQRLKETANSAQSEVDRLLVALVSANWNKSEAALKLNWSRMTLYRKMAKYNLMTCEGRVSEIKTESAGFPKVTV